MMKLIPISAGNLKGDGGALFSVIPKVLWSKVMPCDENNFVKLSLRCLLIDLGGRKILVETGVGEHYNDKFLRNQGLKKGNHLINSLTQNGYSGITLKLGWIKDQFKLLRGWYVLLTH